MLNHESAKIIIILFNTSFTPSENDVEEEVVPEGSSRGADRRRGLRLDARGSPPLPEAPEGLLLLGYQGFQTEGLRDLRVRGPGSGYSRRLATASLYLSLILRLHFTSIPLSFIEILHLVSAPYTQKRNILSKLICYLMFHMNSPS